jgi:hypothetical protein
MMTFNPHDAEKNDYNIRIMCGELNAIYLATAELDKLAI